MFRWFQTTTTVGDIVEQGRELIEQGQETVTQIVEAAKADPALLAVLIGVGVITAGVFVWGIAKQVFKAALVAGLLSAAVWFWYFNIR
jgi:hypothetical protein